MGPDDFACPNCGSAKAWLSHRHGALEFIRHHLAGTRPYRCARCRRRFFAADLEARRVMGWKWTAGVGLLCLGVSSYLY